MFGLSDEELERFDRQVKVILAAEDAAFDQFRVPHPEGGPVILPGHRYLDEWGE